DERQRRCDHLIARAEAGDVAEHVQARRPARDGRCVRRADALRERLLEAFDPRAERQPSGPQHLEDELLLPLVDPRPGERYLPDGFRHASAGAGDTDAYSSQWAQRSLRPRTVSRYAFWISSVTGPGGPTM